MSQTVIVPANIGNTIKAHHLAANKYDVQIDGTTIKATASGELSVDTTSLNVVIVSADAGQVLTAGSDGGAYIDNEAIQDAVGDLVISATDGLTYDDALNSLSAAVASAMGTDTDSIAMGVSLNAGVLNITAKVKIDPSANNLITLTSNGLMVDSAAVAASTTNVHTLVSDSSFKTVVNGITGSTTAIAITDAFGVYIGDMVK